MDLRPRAWLRRSGGIALLAITACSSASDPAGGRGGLDPRALPAELLGLVPGVSTEADALAAAKDWPELRHTRDKKYGGEGIAAFNGQPAIYVSSRGREVTLVELDGAPRAARIRLPIARPCAELFAPLHLEVKRFGCGGNRLPDDGEQRSCTRTPDGKRTIHVSCFDGKSLDLQVDFPRGDYAM